MFDNLDITAGFVLNRYDAIKYIDDTAKQHTEEIMNGNEDTEGIEVILEELREIKRDMKNLNYEYWHIEEHPMTASGLHATPMIKKED